MTLVQKPRTTVDASDEIDSGTLPEYYKLSSVDSGNVQSTGYGKRSKAVVEPLRSRGIIRASVTLAGAMEDDPVGRYICCLPDTSNSILQRYARILQMAITVRWWVYCRTGYTVNSGRAVVCAPLIGDLSIITRLLDKAVAITLFILQWSTGSREQRKRTKEVHAKFDEVVKETLGDRSKDMRVVDALATHPESQRKGYGRALVEVITGLADSEGRATYLLSSNSVNAKFYRSCGFAEVATVMIGEDNPAWREPSIPVVLMVRECEPKIKSE